MRTSRSLSILLVTLVTALAGRAGAACPDEPASEVLSSRLDAAAAAYADLDVQAFDATMDDAAFAVPCLEHVVAPRLAARYHRLQGLRLFVARDEERAVRAFAAARSIEPRALLPADLVSEGHAVHDLYGRFELQNGSFTELPPPATGWIAVDGGRSERRPADWPALVQIVDADDQVTASAYLFPGEALPDYRVDPDWIPPEPPTGGTPWQGILFGTAGGAAISAGFAYGLAVASAQSFQQDHPSWSRSDLEAARARTNGLVVTSAVLGTVAVGAGVGGLIVSR